MLLGYVLKFLTQIVFIFSLSYFLGIFWFIYCDLAQFGIRTFD